MSLLAGLRSEGAAGFDPVRFAYLEALSRRLQGQPEAVRRLLQDKLDRGVAEYAERFAATRPVKPICVVGGVRRKAADAVGGPLAQLNRAFRPAADAGELTSVTRFRQVWTRTRVAQQVEQAVSRKPANAGPLNSHVLVLQSLSVLRELSPAYLQRFLAHVESLQWLEQVAPPKAAKVPKKRATRSP